MGIFGWFSSDDTTEDERDTINLNLKEGLDPNGVFSDWGDMPKDHNQAQADASDGRATLVDEHGVGYPTAEETERSYDSLCREDITIN